MMFLPPFQVHPEVVAPALQRVWRLCLDVIRRHQDAILTGPQ